jgi:hypothetical protein
MTEEEFFNEPRFVRLKGYPNNVYYRITPADCVITAGQDDERGSMVVAKDGRKALGCAMAYWEEVPIFVPDEK